MNKSISPQKENGQAMVIMAFALIVLLGILALAIDGGRAFTERRKAQNAADAATMAAVRELGSGASSVTAKRIAYETALSNGYTLTEEDISIIDVAVDYGGSYNPELTASYEVSVTVDSGIEAAFAQFVYDSFLDVNAHSAMEVVLKHTPFAGFGIVTLGSSCSNGNSPGPGIDASGGGGSGGISVYESSILVNADDPNCAYSQPTSTNNDGLFACSLYFPLPISNPPPPAISYDTPEEACLGAGGQPVDMYSVGAYVCSDPGCENLGSVEGDFNEGQSLEDPLANLPAPVCADDHRGEGNQSPGATFNPGIWNDKQLSSGTYLPGIYCIKHGAGGDGFKITGGTIYAESGVLFYFEDNADVFSVTGGGSILLNAPGKGTGLNCPNAPEPLDSPAARAEACNYQGMVIYVEHGLDAKISLGGNGEYDIYGTIYGDNTTFEASGGGASTGETKVHGQILVAQVNNGGGGTLQVWYDEDYAYIVPPYINALD